MPKKRERSRLLAASLLEVNPTQLAVVAAEESLSVPMIGVIDMAEEEVVTDGGGATTILEGKFQMDASSTRRVHIARFVASGKLTSITAAGTLVIDITRNGSTIVSRTLSENAPPLTDKMFQVKADIIFYTRGAQGRAVGTLAVLSNGGQAFNSTIVENVAVPTTFADAGDLSNLSMTWTATNAGGASTYDDISGYLEITTGIDGSDETY